MIDVVFCSHEYPPDKSGIASYVYELSRALVAKGENVTVITLSYSSKRIECNDRGVRIVWLPVHFPIRWAYIVFSALEAKYAIPIPSLFWLFARLDRAFLLWSELKPWRLHGANTVVEFPEINAEGLFFAIFRPCMLRTVVRLHGCMPVIYKEHGRGLVDAIVYAMEKLVTCRADLVTSPSKDAAERTFRVFDIDPQVKRLKVIPNGINTEVFCPSNSTERDPNVVLFVGRLEFNKGPDRLVTAIPYIFNQTPAAKFLFAGPDSEGMIGHLQEQLSEAHRPRVEFLGGFERQELIPFYQRCAVAVFPSRYETFGYTCLEAMTCGAAVVAHRVGGLAELIEHGQTGLLVNADNPEELGRAIVSLLQDAELRHRFGEAAVAHVQERYSSQVVGDLMIECYKRLIAGTAAMLERSNYL